MEANLNVGKINEENGSSKSLSGNSDKPSSLEDFYWVRNAERLTGVWNLTLRFHFQELEQLKLVRTMNYCLFRIANIYWVLGTVLSDSYGKSPLFSLPPCQIAEETES